MRGAVTGVLLPGIRNCDGRECKHIQTQHLGLTLRQGRVCGRVGRERRRDSGKSSLKHGSFTGMTGAEACDSRHPRSPFLTVIGQRLAW